jgi:hypothetical protein
LQSQAHFQGIESTFILTVLPATSNISARIPLQHMFNE